MITVSLQNPPPNDGGHRAAGQQLRLAVPGVAEQKRDCRGRYEGKKTRDELRYKYEH